MRVQCPECGEKSNIQKTNRLSLGYADLYCSCSDPDCGHSFVMNLTFSHTLSPSAKRSLALIGELIKQLGPQHQQELKQQLNLL